MKECVFYIMGNAKNKKWIAIIVDFIFIETILSTNTFTASAISCRKDGFDKSKYTLTGNMAEDVATIAKSQEGRTRSDFGYTEAWCDEFVADCIENAGADSSIVGHGGTVADFEKVMRGKGAVTVNSPRVGDLVFFTKSHVEIVTAVNNGTVYCAGGNNGGGQGYCRPEHPVSYTGTVRLYLRPNYRNNPSPDIVTPTISTDKSSYIVGDTIYTSWIASSLSSNISHYWINVIAPDGTWIYEGNMNLDTSYSFSASQEGEYTVRVYATPKGSKDGEGSLSDERKISVASATWYGSLSPVNLGETFDSVLLAKDPWITIRALGAEEDYNVILQSEQGITSEMWRFTRQDDGSYVITNFATGRVLDAYGLGTTDFTNVFTDVYNGGGNQKWFIYEKNGGYVLRPAYSDMVLDVDHAIFESGTNIEIHTQNDSTAQNFALYYENASYGTPKTGNMIAKADGCTVTLNIDKGFYIDRQNIYRSTDKENWLLINSGTNEDNLTVIDVGLNENMTYYYKVTYSNRYYDIESDIASVTTGHKSIVGDCNNDGSFTVADVIMLQKWLLSDGTVLGNWKAADLYSDDMLNGLDLVLMKQLVLE